MPKRKKLPPVPDYVDGGRNPSALLVQKTNPLLTLSETGMTLPELKILDVYLSRIDSHDPEKRFIRLEKGVIEQLLKVTQIKPQDLEKRIDNLFQTITIRDERKPKGFTKIALFEKAVCYQDDDGLWQIDLGASWSAMEYFFTPENLGYLRYKLANVVNLTSRYSYVLYLWLEHNRVRCSWEIDLGDLKAMLRCTAESYDQFKRFNDLVLKKCQKEILEKTNCRYTYEPVKKGRTVRAVRFTVETLPVIEVEPIDPDQISFDDIRGDQLELLQSACCPSGSDEPEFTRFEMQEIFEVLVTIPLHKLPTAVKGVEFQRHHYLAQKYAAMNRANERKKIKNRFAYFLKMVKADAVED